MEYTIIRSSDEIDELMNQCANAEDEGGSKFFGMTYEQGIQAAIDWLTEEDQPEPLEG